MEITKALEHEIKMLCMQFIQLATLLKDRGILSECDYKEHIAQKKKFLQSQIDSLIA